MALKLNKTSFILNLFITGTSIALGRVGYVVFTSSPLPEEPYVIEVQHKKIRGPSSLSVSAHEKIQSPENRIERKPHKIPTTDKKKQNNQKYLRPIQSLPPGAIFPSRVPSTMFVPNRVRIPKRYKRHSKNKQAATKLKQFSSVSASMKAQSPSSEPKLNSASSPTEQSSNGMFESVDPFLAANKSIELNFELPSDASQSVLEYSLDDGLTYTLISTLSEGVTNYQWIAPTADTSTASLRISGVRNGSTYELRSNTFTIDGTLPDAPLTSLHGPTPTNLLGVQLTIASCTDRDQIHISETSATPDINSSVWIQCSTDLGALTTMLTGPDGPKSLYIFAKDKAGNISSSSSTVNVTLDRISPPSPSVSLASAPETSTDTSTLTVSDCNGIHSVKVTETSTTPSSSSGGWQNCTTAVGGISHLLVNTSEGPKTLYIWSRDSTSILANINSTADSVTLLLDKTKPEILQTVINPSSATDGVGDPFTGTANIILRLKARDNLSSNLSVMMMELPSSGFNCQDYFADANWQSYAPATSEAPLNYFLTVSAIDGVKKICTWIKDGAGNTSVIGGFTPEAVNVNLDTITYEVGNIPFTSSFSVINDSGTARQGTTDFLINEKAKIDYTIEDVEGLHLNPIAISYTTDNAVWKDLQTHLETSNPANITWFGSLPSNMTSYSGTSNFNAPTGSYFKFKITVRDQAGNTSIPVQSDVLNGTPWSVYAGTTDIGDGGTALAAQLSSTGATIPRFAISPVTNDLFAVDQSGGYRIRKLDAKTGIVSTFTSPGTDNLVDGGTLPSKITLNIDRDNSAVKFDQAGRLYIMSVNGLWQINFDTKTSKLYLKPKTSNASATATWEDVAWAGGSFTFDEDDSLYFFADCEPSTGVKAVRIMKLTQNTNGSPGTMSIVAGNCAAGNPSGTAPDALTIPLGSSYSSGTLLAPYRHISSLAVFGRGKYVYYAYYLGNGIINKILDGKWYPSNMTFSTFNSFIYNHRNGKIYHSQNGEVWEYTPNTSGANGEAGLLFVSGTNTGINCGDDGVLASETCVNSGQNFDVTSSGLVLFSDGAVVNTPGKYRIRYKDPVTSKVSTLLGSLPFYGNGLSKNVIRGDISGIYYKKSSEPNQVTFPEGLYFMERSGLILGHIHPSTFLTSVLFGNQTMNPISTPDNGIMASTSSLGKSYGGGDGYPLIFDKDGLPWFRAQSKLYSIDASKRLIYRMTGSSWWGNLNDGDSPSLARLHVSGSTSNLTLSNDGVFIIGVSYNKAPINQNPSIRYFDFTSDTTTRIMGDQPIGTSPDSTLTPGLVKDLSLKCSYGNSRVCFTYYDKLNDILYFVEPGLPKIRYITDATDTNLSKLYSINLLRNPYNFTIRPDGSELYYLYGSGLFCKNLTGAGNCDESKLGPDPFIGTIGYGANQLTWVDNSTLLISTYNGLVLRYQTN